jgi:hypothetical protein
MNTLNELIGAYDPAAPLERASTIPSSWYTDRRIFQLEQQTVFSHSWQVAARSDQLRKPGDYVTADTAGEQSSLLRAQTIESADSSMCAVTTQPRL